MNIDLVKYLKNKDVKITNEDFDIENLSKDLYQGYTKNEDIKPPKDMVSRDDYSKLQKDYATLETTYNNTVKTLSETNDKMARVSLESRLVRKGFDEKDFDEIVKLRGSLYADEKDDQKAVDSIAEKFKDTYLKAKKSDANSGYNPAPNENTLNGNNGNVGTKPPIKITRTTSLKDMQITSN